MNHHNQITGHTKLTGLLGSPVSHSISPMMHNEAFRMLGLDYVYLAFDVGTDTLKAAVEGLRAMNVRGFNLTMPNKTLMCNLCDRLSPASEFTGAVNTVVNDNGVFTGYTTDGLGYLRAVEAAGYQIIGKKMTILGTGGAATAIFVQAALSGVAEISVFNRPGASFTRAEKLIADLSERTGCKMALFDLTDESALRREIADSTILTNATSVGMAPDFNGCLITDASFLHKDLIVSDIIYNPGETPLLRLAKETGCAAFNGLSMLLYQGAEAFRLWTGKEMPVDKIKRMYFE